MDSERKTLTKELTEKGMVTRNAARKERMIETESDGLLATNNQVSPEHYDTFDAHDSDVDDHVSIKESKSEDFMNAKLRLYKAKILKRRLEERLELERRLKLSEVEQEIELAEIEVGLAEDLENLPPLINALDIESKIDPASLSYASKPHVPLSVVNAVNHEFINELKCSLSNVVNCSGLPKLEMPVFRGQPEQYWNFVRQFDSVIANKIADKGLLLSYLLYYCDGKAKAAIETCVSLPVDLGYQRARQILCELFGQGHMVARSCIDRLVKSNKGINNSAESLTDFAVQLRNTHMTLSQMGYLADLDSPTNLEGIVSRLPIELQGGWVELADKIIHSGREPVFEDVVIFVESKARVSRTRYGALLQRNKDNRRSTGNSNSYKGLINVIQTDEAAEVPKFPTKPRGCFLCPGNHNLTSCPEFLKLSVHNKRSEVKRLGVCYLCMKPRHTARLCLSNLKCAIDGCNIRHHPLLHIKRVGSSVIHESSSNHIREISRSKVYFGVVPVRLFGPAGSVETYAFLDSGSDTSLITQKLAHKLGLNGKKSELNLTTLTGSTSHTCKEVNLELFALDGSGSVEISKAYTVSKLPIGEVGTPSIDELSRWQHLKGIEIPTLPDRTVSILIGCEVPDAHWVLEQKLGDRKHPFAVRTHLGWMVMGPSGVFEQKGMKCLCACQIEMSMQFDRLYEHEFSDLDSFKKELSVDDKHALNIANKTVKFKDGHFEVGLPWKVDNPKLPDNYVMARKRLECLRKRFLRDGGLFERYRKVMEGHLLKGYLSETSQADTFRSSLKWFIPHHPVINPKKPEKLRVVFDCAAQHGGTSLNDQLFQGPNMINNLIGVLLRFRGETVAVAADIEEMFLQVKIPVIDRGALRLLWWKDSDLNSQPAEFRLTVHPFGAVSSPFCADFALRKTIQEFATDTDEMIHRVVDDHFYVDDCLLSIEDETKAIQLIQQLTSILQRGGFRLTKWISNNQRVLESIPVEERAPAMRAIDFEKPHFERTLGLCWDTNSDAFIFKVQLPLKAVTRRGILSTVASLYDPLGLLSPFILPAKQLLQRLCKMKLEWDADIPEGEIQRWHQWLKTVEQLAHVAFPRCWKPTPYNNASQLQLHMFCDASEVGYGAVAYIRTTMQDSSNTSLMIAKCRVAPLKVQTIPRLELTAAVLAARISEMLQTELRIKFEKIVYWTDSTVVLHYINNTKDRFHTFVANRLAIIHRTSRPDQWRHVSSEDNIADWISRGLENVDGRFDTWLKGPKFLSATEDTWPRTPLFDDSINFELEIRKTAQVNTITREIGLCKLISYHSDWLRLLKSVVWLTRFKSYIIIKFGNRPDHTLQVGHIKGFELELARNVVIKQVQVIAFANELKILSSKPSHSSWKGIDTKLRKLNPIIIDGLLKVGGRLQNSNQPEEIKHPIILPSKHHITDLVISFYHELEGHIGTTQLLATVRERFWILRGGASVRRVIGRCIVCRRNNPRWGTQIMAPLPSARVNAGDYPFMSVGVDYFGPIIIKRGRVREKRYGCIFTCLKTRAIHLEVAHSLSTDSFLMALMRFIGRRGTPHEIFSDNGSNLVGAKNELKKQLDTWTQGEIRNRLLRHDIQWHFNPPLASHWGGVWERMIRSVRRVLSVLSNQQVMSDECLSTYMVEAERIINNRPLTPVTEDSNDLEVLTPAKLLLLRDNVVTLGGLEHNNQYVRRWRKASYLADIFWRRWTKEYVSTLQQRQKWLTNERNFKVGDIVMIASDLNIRNKWPLGRVTRVCTGSDGLVRQVEVKTSNGYLIRDIRKVCLLEANDEV